MDQYLTCAESRSIDRIAIEHYGFNGLVLMENAARACVDVLERLGCNGSIRIFCGGGNNGGDGFAIARHAIIRGFDAHVDLCVDPDRLTGEARSNWIIAERCGIPRTVCKDDNDFTDPAENIPTAWIVDCLLGTGAHGNPRPPFDAAIRRINFLRTRFADRLRVLAVDLPSGLDADRGIPNEPTIRADHTATFVAPKTGFQASAAQPFLGKVHVLGIGIPDATIQTILAGCGG